MAKKPAQSSRNSPNIKPLKNGPTRSMNSTTGSAAGLNRAVSSSPVRNSALPKAHPATRDITHEQIARRAYEIYISGSGGSPEENWLRAERELRGGF